MKLKSASLMQFLNIVTAIALFLMTIFVFGNVVLRYLFNSGITWSEEASRFLFIWMTFLGAIVAFRHNQHLGVDLLVKRFPRPVKKIVYILINIVIAFMLWLIFDGGLKLIGMNTENIAPATGIPMSYIFASSVIMSIGMFLVLIFNLYRVLKHDNAIDELTKVHAEDEVFEQLTQPQDAAEKE
jgi:TRAP-type C4-dicarboxylate transport system permease small subunit